MHILSYESGATTLKCGTHTAERVRVTHGMAAQLGAHGEHLSRPPHYEARARRLLRRTKGDPTLFRMAVTGLEANVLARATDQQSKLKVVLRRLVNRRRVPLQSIELQRVQIVQWGLHWEGDGADGLQGATFEESLTAFATKGSVTSTVDNNTVTFDLE